MLSPRLKKLLHDLQGGKQSALDTFWPEVSQQGAPLIERMANDAQHVLVTFLWRASEPIENVMVIGQLGAGQDFAENCMQRLLDTNLWYKTYQLRSDLRAAYTLSPNDSLVPYHKVEDWLERVKTWQPDPLNPPRRRHAGNRSYLWPWPQHGGRKSPHARCARGQGLCRYLSRVRRRSRLSLLAVLAGRRSAGAGGVKGFSLESWHHLQTECNICWHTGKKGRHKVSGECVARRLPRLDLSPRCTPCVALTAAFINRIVPYSTTGSSFNACKIIMFLYSSRSGATASCRWGARASRTLKAMRPSSRAKGAPRQ